MSLTVMALAPEDDEEGYYVWLSDRAEEAWQEYCEEMDEMGEVPISEDKYKSRWVAREMNRRFD